MAALTTIALRERVEACWMLDDILRIAINPEAMEPSAKGNLGKDPDPIPEIREHHLRA